MRCYKYNDMSYKYNEVIDWICFGYKYRIDV